MPCGRWGIGADPVLAGARFSRNHRTLPGVQAEAPKRGERSHRPGAVAPTPTGCFPKAQHIVPVGRASARITSGLHNPGGIAGEADVAEKSGYILFERESLFVEESC